MRMSKIILILILNLVYFVPLHAEATKCLKKMDIRQLKAAFPAVIKGKVLSRDKIDSPNESYRLKIQVTKTLKGKLKDTELSVNEEHFKTPMVKRIYYKVGKEYTFPLEKNQDGKFGIILPGDGCPELP